MYEIQISRPTIEDLPNLDTFFEMIYLKMMKNHIS